ncbi:MAG: TolC family protein [Planctomycetes bacterium]|jgi:outer membrane protein TolC|nr:TolC family protein [Phycisphaerae bacterium]NBB95107.1 TolC family protein [Planctomycetota bacterium]
MTAKLTTIFTLLAPLVVGGCVQPNVLRDERLERLHMRILARSPQQRDPEGLGPMQPAPSPVPPVGVLKNLKTGKPMVKLSLHDTVVRALANNTDIAVVAYDPKIAYQQAVQEAAEFDYTLFGGIGYSTIDDAWRHRTGRPIEKERTVSAGVRNRTPAGTEWSVTQEMVREWDDSAVDSISRWYRPNLAVEVTQPLLRNAWPGVNLAPLQIARLDYRISMSEFRAQVEATLVEVIRTYYRLQQARGALAIGTKLLKETQDTLRRIRGRRELDATDVPIMQTESAVRTRQAGVVRASKNVADVRDALLRLIGDQRLNMLDDVEVVPVTDMRTKPVRISVIDQLLTALVMNPQLEQARLAIRQGEINVRVAKNQTLPELNVSAGAEISGGAHGRHEARNDYVSGDYISYNAELTFEYPIGNREREALLAQRRLEHHQAVSEQQTVADQVAETVRERIRQVETRYVEFDLQRKAAEASAAQLRGLNELETKQGQLTPEFLNLKLRAQETLAEARRAELAAMTDYNIALLELTEATGAVLDLNQVQLAMPEAGIAGAPLAEPAPRAKQRPAPPAKTTSPPPLPGASPVQQPDERQPLPPARFEPSPPQTAPQPATPPKPIAPPKPVAPPEPVSPPEPTPLEQINISDS